MFDRVSGLLDTHLSILYPLSLYSIPQLFDCYAVVTMEEVKRCELILFFVLRAIF